MTTIPRVILDTDFNTMGDDGQVLVMLARAMRRGQLELLGVTTVTGNEWVEQETAEALRAVERLGLGGRVPVHAGAVFPLLRDEADIEAETAASPGIYTGAWRKPRPNPADILPPPDGFAAIAAASAHAVDFLVDAIRTHPGEVTVLAIGPLTNLALAFRKAPDIALKLQRIVYMGGAVDVPGNITATAEFNWWFDPEAARIVLRQPVPHVVVPLDLTNRARFGKDVFDAVATGDAVVGPLFAATYAATFEADPAAGAEIWDTLAAAAILEPGLVTTSRDVWLDLIAIPGPDYGRSVAFEGDPPPGARRATLLLDVDLDRFWRFYVEALTDPFG